MLMRGAADRIEQEAKRQLAAAWYTAAFVRAKQMPRLSELLRDPGPKSHAEVSAHLRQITRNMPKRTWEEWRKL